jgi:tetratricopeptide (TPR) repeat protein
MTVRFFGPAALATILIAGAPNRAAQGGIHLQQPEPEDANAKHWLDSGVQAYKQGETEVALVDFKKATELDPTLISAQLYLATAYASQYIPGAPGEENIQYGKTALQAFQEILKTQTNNKTAIDGIASILYNIASEPFDLKMMEESKAYHRKHIVLAPNDAQPYYWIGVIDWSIAYRANAKLREQWSKGSSGTLGPEDPLPEVDREEFSAKYAATVKEGIDSLKKAIDLNPDYDDAMAYLNLLYKQKAEMESSGAARDEDLNTADNLVERAISIKQRKMAQAEQSPEN